MKQKILEDHIHGPKSKTPRYPQIDITRGFAVLLMIIFHFSYDLSAFKYVDISFQNDRFWWVFPRVIVFFFLIAMGQSLELVHRKSIHWKVVLKRFIKIGFFALCISAFTYYAFPKSWIYFGTLHCIALASVLVLPFVGRPRWTIAAALAVLIPLLWGYQLPWFKLPHASMDYIPLFPWIGVVFLGQLSVEYNLHTYNPPKFPARKLLSFFGKHSLKIYLVHQPILFGLVKAYYVLTH